jgi:AcrR family transcriptional regulator
MIDSVGANGYRATSVADVIGRAGVSRETFYEHFANKQECFLATYDLVWAESRRRVARAYREAEGWPARAQAAIAALFEAAIENPGAVRLATVEIGALGPAGIERREQSVAEYERFIADAVELTPGAGRISDTAARAVVGGLYRILDRRVSSGEHTELLELVPDLVTWATSYYPTPPAIAEPRPGRARTRAGIEGGRAPGTLAPHSAFSKRRGLARGNQNVSRSFVVHSQCERILDAVANLTAKEGYAALNVNDIAAEAAISLGAFYEHFADKEDAFLAAYELGHAKGLALVERAYAAQADWRQGVKAALGALLGYLASEPSFAHLTLIETLSATRRTSDRFYGGIGAYAQTLPRFEEARKRSGVPSIAIEATTGGLFELCLHHAIGDRIRELPELTSDATYIALAPFIGAEEAARVARTPIGG